MLQHWTLTFLGNLAGALFIVGIVIGHGGVFDDATAQAEILKIATSKAVTVCPMFSPSLSLVIAVPLLILVSTAGLVHDFRQSNRCELACLSGLFPSCLCERVVQ